ncbi:amidohydrolase family protein [Ferrimonas kyonanensis]|uniref:amidohydrolase family protein n=1 Tax=Ferrimonas kyonanensis TaxID=364763 RepID=UPI00316ACA5C
MMKTLYTLLLLALGSPALATALMVAPPQSQPILIQGGTLHTVTQGVLPNTDLLVEAGRIRAIGTALPVPADARLIDASGQRVYPGLIALANTLGLEEIEMIRSTVDSEEVGQLNPQLRAAVAYNPDSELIPTVRSNGITHIQLTPSGDLLAGTSSLLNLDAWNLDDALVPGGEGLHLYWPDLHLSVSDDELAERQRQRQQRQLTQLNQAFEQAYGYYLNRQHAQRQDRRWQAMLPVFEGQRPLFVHADTQPQIEQALRLADRYRLKMVLVGGYDSYRLIDQLLAQQVPVVYTHANSLPLRRHEPVDLPFTIPALLADAGVELALAYPGSWDSRNLPFAAGYAAAHGLGGARALKAITLSPANILGLSDMGALEVGYRANLVISDGDLLDIGQSRVSMVLIDGRQIDLNNRHKQLYHKYLNKPAR